MTLNLVPKGQARGVHLMPDFWRDAEDEGKACFAPWLYFKPGGQPREGDFFKQIPVDVFQSSEASALQNLIFRLAIFSGGGHNGTYFDIVRDRYALVGPAQRKAEKPCPASFCLPVADGVAVAGARLPNREAPAEVCKRRDGRCWC